MNKFRWLFLVLTFASLISCDIQGILDSFVLENTQDRTDLLQGDKMHVVLVGTGGPAANEDRISQCTAVIAGGEFVLVDTGPGSARRGSLLKLPGAHLSAILLTHYHSDHIGDLGETNIQSWMDGRPESLDVFGPEGVADIVEGFNTAYERDVKYRNSHHLEVYMPLAAGRMNSTTITFSDPDSQVLVFDRNGLKVYAFMVNHDPATPAVGYRFEYRGNVVVITGDTIKTDNLAVHARNADILVSEVLSFNLVNMIVASLTRLGLERQAHMAQDVLDYHMDPVHVGEVAQEAGVKKVVLTHIFPPLPSALSFLNTEFTDGVKVTFNGEVVMGEDGLFLELEPKPVQ